jgi:hypothetical protein
VREQEERLLGCEGRAAGGAGGQASVPVSAAVTAPGGSA